LNSPSAAAHPLVRVGSGTHSLSNRFLLSAIAFLRNKQLNQGATARVARDGHKATYVAVLEVMGETVSWSRE
jgi:hypothetical protein